MVGHLLTEQRIEREKTKNLQGNQGSSAPHKEHAPGWNEHLAVSGPSIPIDASLC